MMPFPVPTNWRKSSYSGEREDCVEVALGEVIGVRDTKIRDGGMLVVSPVGWSAFIAVLARTARDSGAGLPG